MTDTGDDVSVVLLSALLPVVALVWAHTTGGGYSAARVAFVLTGLTSILIHVATERWRSSARSAPLAAAIGVSLAAALAVATHGETGLGARAALASATALTIALAAPPLAVGSQVWWRLWLMITCLALLTNPSASLLLVVAAIVWWMGARLWSSFGLVDAGPMAAEVCSPVSAGPGVDTPVVNGSIPVTVVERLLEEHPRVLVQVGDLVIGELSRPGGPFPAPENPRAGGPGRR